MSKMHRRAAPYALVTLIVSLGTSACSPDALRERLGRAPSSPREQYVSALTAAGLDRSALAHDWIAAGERALAAPVVAPVPVQERGFFPAGEAAATAYRVTVPVGRRAHVRVEADADSGTRLFVDLWREPADTSERRRLVIATDSLRTSFEVDADEAGSWVLRVQPELLRAVRYTVTVEAGPSLAFPVDGRDSRAVKSFWGVDRDGGARRHEGIDIFAPRGTPAIAASNGVAWVGENRLGGRVVFLRNTTRSHSLYYAHLDTQFVQSGAVVRAGDTLGLVGNSGNARTTSPHLHFGVYRARRRGAQDPFPFVDTRRVAAVPWGRDSTWIGRVARTAAAAVVRAGAGAATATHRSVPRQTVLLVEAAASGGWLRVRLPDASTGYVAASALESLGRPVATTQVAAASALRSRPALGAPPVQVTARPVAAPVYGRFGDYLLVEVDGQRGWVGAAD